MTTGRDLEAVLDRVGERVDPDQAEQAALEGAASALIDRTEAAVADLPVDADVLQVGSTSRDTWVRGDRDIDVFVRFDPDLDRADLERLGLAIGHEVLPDGRAEYAEHPYVTGTFEGFDVDLVPCYAVETAAEIRSAVDRTPFHDAYLQSRLEEDSAAEVRRFKGFLKGVGVYGSDLRTRGFSGYLTELLVLEYGGFVPTLEAVCEWHPPVRLDPEGHGERSFEDPLVVIDPTDPQRNVAAVVSATNVARLLHHARAFLEEPSMAFFEQSEPQPLTAAAVEAAVEKRGTTPIAVVFDPPDLLDDQLYPQLRRSLAGLETGLSGADFEVLRSATWAQDRAVLFVELAVAERPAVERHEGPPVHAADHARRFYATYADEDSVTGPFIEGADYVVERERALRTAADFVSERLLEVALGAQIEPALEAGYEVLVGTDIAALAPEFGTELAGYFDPRP